MAARLAVYRTNMATPAVNVETGRPVGSVKLVFYSRLETGCNKSHTMKGTMERYTRFLEDNPDCFPLFDENLADEGTISISGIASPAFIMSIPQWKTVFGA